MSVRLSQHGPAAANPLLQTAGLLLWAWRAGDNDRLMQQRHAVGECGQCHIVTLRR